MGRTRTILESQPDQVLSHNDLVQARDVRMAELAVMMDFAREVGILLAGRLEHDLGAIGELVRRQVDFAEGALSDQPAQRVIPYAAEVLGGEFPVEDGSERWVMRGWPGKRT